MYATYDARYLKLDQTTPQTITASPILNWGTATRVPYYSATKTLIDSAGLTFDENSLLPSNLIVTPSALGAEKITNGAFTGQSSTGWSLGASWSLGYVFTVSGITTSPLVNSTYTNNGITFTTRYTLITGTAPNKSGFMVMTGSGNPSSGNLTKASGTGDNTVAFSAWTGSIVFHTVAGVETVTQTSAAMVTPLIVNEWYTLQFDVVNKSSAAMSCVVTCGGSTLMTATANGTHKTTFRATSTANLVFTPTTTSRFGIDNISLKKATGIIQGASLLLTGTSGSTPTAGAGTRLMWIPEKAAFRCGAVTGTQFDDGNIGLNSIAMGNDSKASGSSALALGQQSEATAANAYAIGDNNRVTADNACAIGTGNNLTAVSAYIYGVSNTVSGYGSTAIGSGNEVSGTNCTVLGSANILDGETGTAVGSGSAVTGSYGVVIGYGVVFTGADYGISIGSNNSIGDEGGGYGAYSVGIGSVNIVLGNYATCIGYTNRSDGDYAVALGSYLQANGTSTLAFGYGYIEATNSSFNWGYGQRDFQLTSANAIFGAGLAGVDYTMSFPGETNSGEFKWMEDEDYFKFSDDIALPDNEAIKFGTGVDSSIYYDGTNQNIDTDLVAPSDLVVDCGTAKTIVLEVPVYKDINLGAAAVWKPTSGYPDIVQFKDEAGNDTGIETYAFALNESISGQFEIQHDYQEGGDLTFHVHWQGIAAPAGGTDNVQWRLKYTITRDGQTINAPTTVDSPDAAITAQYQCVRNDFAIIEGTTGGYDGGNIKIGDQFCFILTRVDATADEYGGDALMITCGVHYPIDTIGSRSVGTK
jgi:hypothetical protein